MISTKGVFLLLVCLSAALVNAQYQYNDNNNDNNNNNNDNQDQDQDNENNDQNGPFNQFCNDQEQSCYFDVCSQRISGFNCDSETGQITEPCTCLDGNSSPAVEPTTTPTSSPSTTPVTPSTTPAATKSGAAHTAVGVMSTICIAAVVMLA